MSTFNFPAPNRLTIETGNRFGRLTIVSEGPKKYPGTNSVKRTFNCRCDCGNEVNVVLENLRQQATQSCGCFQKQRVVEALTVHGQSRVGHKTRAYHLWRGMITRCTRKTDYHYKWYGARGITVCERWKNSFVDFYADVGDPPDGLSFERKDNSKGYEPGNVRWATQKEQSRNTRRNRVLEHDGKKLCVSEWAEIKGAQPRTFFARLKHGWSIQETIETPVRECKPS